MRVFLFIFSLLLTVSGPPAVSAQQTTVPRTVSFNGWVKQFRPEALKAGIRPQIFDAAFRGVKLNGKILELDGRQAEFVKPIWSYLDSAVSDTRVENGRKHYARLNDLMQQITARYGVDPGIVLAIWGVESNYGSNYGKTYVIEALASLAYDGRREKWAKEQLIEALKILQRGDIAPQRMRGSWAGAMGHTQFIPTSFASYAVDFDGDGRRNIWDEYPADALASTANYLARHKWRSGEPAAMQVIVPPTLPLEMFDADNRLPAEDWVRLGVRSADGRPLPALKGAVIMPGGARGLAFMIYDNFGVIRRYNNATSYALAVAHLGDRIKGGGPFLGDWPRGEKPLRRKDVEEMQVRLGHLGFDTGGVDGKLGPNTRKAIRDFQRSIGLPADGFASQSLLGRVRTARPVSTPLAVSREEIKVMQELLNQLGYKAGVVDGIAGRGTRAAISAFQRKHGLAVTGIADHVLLANLRRAAGR